MTDFQMPPIVNISAEGNVQASGAMFGVAKRLVAKALKGVDDYSEMVHKRQTIEWDERTKFNIRTIPGDPPTIKVVIETAEPEPVEIPQGESFIPAVNNPELILGGGICGGPFGTPGKRMFTQILGYDARSGDGNESTKEFETTEAGLYRTTSLACSKYEVNRYCNADSFDRKELDLPFEFKFCGQTFSKGWVSQLTFSFSGPGLIDPEIWTSGTVADFDNCHKPGAAILEYLKNSSDQDDIQGAADNGLGYMITVNGRIGDHCSEEWTSVVHGTHGRFVNGPQAPGATDGGGGGGFGAAEEIPGTDMPDISDRESELFIDETGRYNEVDQTELTKLSESVLGLSNYSGKALGIGGGSGDSQSGDLAGASGARGEDGREFFAITIHDYNSCHISQAEYGWETDSDPDTATEFVLVPATESCPAMVGMFVQGPDSFESWDESGFGNTLGGALNDDDGYLGNYEYDALYYSAPELLSYNCDYFNRFGYVAFLSGRDMKAKAWTACGESSASLGSRNPTRNLMSRTFWFILDENGYPYDCLQQVAYGNVQGDDYTEQVYGDVDIDSPVVGRITV